MSYKVPWLFLSERSSFPFLLSRSHARYSVHHLLNAALSEPGHDGDDSMILSASTRCEKARRSRIPIPRPSDTPSIACAKRRFGFIRVAGSMNHTRTRYAARAAYFSSCVNQYASDSDSTASVMAPKRKPSWSMRVWGFMTPSRRTYGSPFGLVESGHQYGAMLR